MRGLISILLLILAGGCASSPHSHVQISRSYPSGSCEEVGQVIGNANTRENAEEQALDDLRYQAAIRSGNYVRLITVAAYGTAARGVAYRCQ